jgi:Domain of unknown function (DUF4956)
MLGFSSITGSASPQTSIWLIIFASLMTVLLSTILVITYDKSSRQVSKPDHFIQSLLLMSIVTCTIMQSIGDSLALSFGIFGALAIIRFRTRISDPRDVAFVFASMAVGIACGVHSFLNGIIGTAFFCLIILIIRFTPFGQKNKMVGNLRLTLPQGDYHLTPIQAVLNKNTDNFSLRRIRVGILENELLRTEYEYKLILQNNTEVSTFAEELSIIDDCNVIRLTFEDENDVEAL